jgi:hypothetical protein
MPETVATYGFSSSLKSFLLGMMAIIPAGIACSAGLCPPEVPPLPVVETAIAAVSAWGVLLKLLLVPFVLEGLLATIAIGAILLLAALMYASL